MPSERFFYRPVSPNYEALGAGIGGGIAGGVSGYLDEKDRKRQRARQDEADARARREEAIYLESLGGGFGEPPEEAGVTELDFGRPGLAAGGPGSILTRDIELGPEGTPIMDRAAAAPPIREYQQVGPDAYIERSESQSRRLAKERLAIERRTAAEERGIAGREREVMMGRAGEAMLGSRSEDPEVKARSGATLMGLGMARYQDLYPTTRAGGRDYTLPSWGDAEETVDAYSDYQDEEGIWHSRLAPGERLAAIQALVRGEPTGVRELDSAMSYGELNQELMGEMFGGPFDPMGQWRSGAGLAPLDPAYVRRTIETLRSLDIPESEWPSALRDSGFSDAEIQRILGR